MKHLARILSLVLGLALIPGCIFVNVKTPLDTDLDRTKLGERTGTSTNYCVLGLVAWGDGGTQAAARDGGIATINHADQRFLSVLGFVYAQRTTIVYGD